MSSNNKSPRRSPRRHSSSSPSFSTRQNPGAEKPRLSPTALSAKRRVEKDNSSVLSPRQKDSNVEIVSSPKRRKYSTPDRELPLSIISDQEKLLSECKLPEILESVINWSTHRAFFYFRVKATLEHTSDV